jgi:hypothetical protein
MSDGDLPSGWVQRESNSRKGAVYYYNTATGESRCVCVCMCRVW